MNSIYRGERVCFLLAILGSGACLASGCAGDRCLFFKVTTQVLDARDQPLVGETVRVIPSAQYRWPSPQTQHGDTAAIDLSKYGEVYRTDPNGYIEFTVFNTEPIEVFTGMILDTFFPPSVEFLIILPDGRPSACAATFHPKRGTYGRDRLTYRQFDLKTGRTLPTTYSDTSGGLDTVVHRAQPDPEDRWSNPEASLHIRIHTGDRG